MLTGIFDQKFFKLYNYMYEPTQLIELTECIRSVRDVPGSFVEAGCAYGATTAFLNRFMDNLNLNRQYYAIDTFCGFPEEHALYEVRQRGKSTRLQQEFVENKKSWFDKSMKMHHIERVKSVQADVAQFDFASIAPIAFCLLDVDLFKPIKEALPKIHAAMSPAGIIVIDDCKPNNMWDGALEAYEEYIREKHLPREIRCDKLGIIRAS
jgi:SAM-dependent methyltransferase